MGGWVGNTHWVFASSSLAFSQIWDSRQIKSFQQGNVKLLLHHSSDSFHLANNQLFESLFHSQGDFSQSLQEGGRGRKNYFKDKGGLNLLPFTFHLSLTFPPSPSKTSHPPQPGSPRCAELAVHHLTIISTRSFRAKSRKYQGKSRYQGRKTIWDTSFSRTTKNTKERICSGFWNIYLWYGYCWCEFWWKFKWTPFHN